MKVAYFANSAWYLHNYVRHLPEAIEKEGHQAILLSPPDKYSDELTNSGLRWYSIPLQRQSLNPFVELKVLWHLVKILRKERPDIIHNFTFKPAFYGSVAGQLVGVPGILNALAYPGRPLMGLRFRTLATKLIVSFFNHFILGTTNAIFQNKEEQNNFVTRGYVKPHNTYLIYGSGVDLDSFRPQALRRLGPKVVLFASRLMWSKGIGEFVEAAQILRDEFPDTIFRIAGEVDPGNPDAVDQNSLNSWRQSPNIDLIGQRDDMADVYKNSDIVVLPTYYREGVPRSLVEAAACGLPLVSSDISGVREIVMPGKNGILIPTKDVASLVKAVRHLLQNDHAREEMGQRSRELAQNKFSKERVLQETVTAYTKMLSIIDHT